MGTYSIGTIKKFHFFPLYPCKLRNLGQDPVEPTLTTTVPQYSLTLTFRAKNALCAAFLKLVSGLLLVIPLIDHYSFKNCTCIIVTLKTDFFKIGREY